ncbi:MAG: sigma-70 family RNA polymerase sigma factor [Imperialibacter sp.]|uniref:sigma-70 family RNA polymerase sigma factor n=1 Tax=Imperialibacter sp. TaxID=2038411 RepID=UPI003A895179
MESAKKSPEEVSAIIGDWVNLHTDDLLRWALNKTNNQAIAEDLVQETFTAAFSYIHGFKYESQPKTWLFSILNNKIIDYHRKKFKNIVLTQSQLQQDGESGNLLEEIYDENGRWRKNSRPQDWGEGNSHLLDDADFRLVLQFCLDELPTKWFSAVHLKYMDEKDGQEICKDLDVTPSNFWQLLRRARLQLRACLEIKWFKSV